MSMKRNSAKAGLLILAVIAVMPGMPSKYLMSSAQEDCINESNWERIKVNPLRLYSEPRQYRGNLDKLGLYFHRGAVKKNNLNIVSSYRKPRSEVLFYSPVYYWLEQKIGHLLRRLPPQRGFLDLDYLNSPSNYFEGMIDAGAFNAGEISEEWSKEYPLTFYGGWTDRSPLEILTVSIAHKEKEEACNKDVFNSFKLVARGIFMPWISMPVIALNRSQIGFLFPGKVKTLLAKINPPLVANKYFEIESSEVVLIVFSPLDLPFWARYILLVVSLAGLLLFARNEKWKVLEWLSANTRNILSILVVNMIFLTVLLGSCLAIIDLLLSKTSLLDEIDSRNPSYLPIKDELMHRRHLWDKIASVNEYGFYDVPIAKYDDEKSCKVAVVGDSFVWGWGNKPNSDERWPAQLQNLLPSCTVFYWGIGGWTSRDEALFLRDKAKSHAIDLIILGFVDNDMNPTVSDFNYNSETVKIIKSSATAPVVVFFTPWNGLDHQRKIFSYAKKLFDDVGIPNHSCLPNIQSLVGFDMAAPRSMWNGLKVDSHPGYPITREIARCVYKYLAESGYSSILNIRE